MNRYLFALVCVLAALASAPSDVGGQALPTCSGTLGSGSESGVLVATRLEIETTFEQIGDYWDFTWGFVQHLVALGTYELGGGGRVDVRCGSLDWI